MKRNRRFPFVLTLCVACVRVPSAQVCVTASDQYAAQTPPRPSLGASVCVDLESSR